MNCGVTAWYEKERMLGGSYLCDCGLPSVFFCGFLLLFWAFVFYRRGGV